MAAGALLDGGGDAWARDHEEILEHARGLGYDKVPGVSLPPADAPKETWISEMDKFNAWKASELAKPEASRWWVIRPWSATEEGGSGGGGGGSYKAANPFFPQLVQEYEAPGLLDWSAYMPEGGLLGNEQYQPWTNPNAIPENVFYYQPPMINYSPGAGFSRGGSYTGGHGGGYEGYMGPESVAPLGESSGKYDTGTLIPGTNTPIQSLFDYEAGDMSETIYDQDGNIERKYYVNPNLRQDLVAQDIERAREDAYIQNAAPIKTAVGQIELTPQQVVDWNRGGIGSPYIQDQLQNEIARVANEIAFRPSTLTAEQQAFEARGTGK